MCLRLPSLIFYLSLFISDAFILNIGKDVWESDRVQTAYDTAASMTNLNFKMFLSIDFSIFNCNDAGSVEAYINQYKNHPAQMKDANVSLRMSAGPSNPGLTSL